MTEFPFWIHSIPVKTKITYWSFVLVPACCAKETECIQFPPSVSEGLWWNLRSTLFYSSFMSLKHTLEPHWLNSSICCAHTHKHTLLHTTPTQTAWDTCLNGFWSLLFFFPLCCSSIPSIRPHFLNHSSNSDFSGGWRKDNGTAKRERWCCRLTVLSM